MGNYSNKANGPVVLFVKQDQEKEKDQIARNKLNKSMGKFFGIYIHKRFNSQKIGEIERKQIIQQLLKYRTFSFRQNNLSKYRSLIDQLTQQLRKFYSQYKRKQSQCTPILQIIRMKITSLKVIHIEYSSTEQNEGYQKYLHQISAYDLFRVIHQNTLLNEATVKGVQIIFFYQFINKIENKRFSRELSWMRDFKPSKFFKLTTNAKLHINMQNKYETLTLIKDLNSFVRLFQWFSQITARVQLGQLNQINDWGSNLLDLWACLRRMKKIKIIIEGLQVIDEIPNQSVSVVRSLIFGGLASFTEIAQLQFVSISFDPLVQVNNFLALEEILEIIFKYNNIHHLKLCNCNNFPNLPQINTLRSIDLNILNFRQDIDFLKEISKPSLLQSIKYRNRQSQQYEIDENLLNGLQTFTFSFFNGVLNTNNMSSSPSKIKQLKLVQVSSNTLQRIFPKLHSLKQLSLFYVQIGHERICTIPSNHLEEIDLKMNASITSQGIKQIDNKWPNLRCISIWKCIKVTESIWNNCKFTGLKEVHIESRIIGSKLRYLEMRGIWVFRY